jgi:hypothetical protein
MHERPMRSSFLDAKTSLPVLSFFVSEPADDCFGVLIVIDDYNTLPNVSNLNTNMKFVTSFALFLASLSVVQSVPIELNESNLEDVVIDSKSLFLMVR